MNNVHHPLPAILYTSELKDAIEEGFVKWAIKSEQLSVQDRECPCIVQLFISRFCI